MGVTALIGRVGNEIFRPQIGIRLTPEHIGGKLRFPVNQGVLCGQGSSPIAAEAAAGSVSALSRLSDSSSDVSFRMRILINTSYVPRLSAGQFGLHNVSSIAQTPWQVNE